MTTKIKGSLLIYILLLNKGINMAALSDRDENVAAAYQDMSVFIVL